MKTGLLALLFLISAMCYSQKAPKKNYEYINPMIGTQRMGHTFPGATIPFGSVQLSPETDTIAYELNKKYNGEVYKYCAGYQYDDKTIVGFSHTHFSGTGHSDLGDFLIMPTTGTLQLNPGTAANPQSGYRSAFSHANEVAQANYYKVKLDDHNIVAELTTSQRVGFHKYTFPKSSDSHIILDLMAGIYNHKEKNVWTFVRVENDTLITGYRQTQGWARTRTVYFAMAFSKPIKNYGVQKYDADNIYKGFWRRFDETKNFPEAAGKNLKMYFDFDTKEGEAIMIKMALSPVSTAGALANMKQEIPHWDFEKTKRDGQQLWEKELDKVKVETINEADKVNFYTALYHAFINPTVYMDIDGSYKGLDQNIHKAEGFTNYTTFSLWDTYRALHPLFNIVQPKRNADMIQSMLAHHDQSVHKALPVWSHYANENWCMIGYHAVSVIADAVAKDNTGFNTDKALQACINSSNLEYYDGIKFYKELGYVPEDKNGSSVSKTLEYAYDDWCIAQMAKKLGKQEVYNDYIKRSANYNNVFDKTIGYMRPKLSDGTFKKQFDPLDTHGQGFIEGNAWNYSLYVPQDPEALIQLNGGKEKFAVHLDSLFTMTLPDKYFENTEDITRDGIIGNYVHGNEPSHHVVYLYNWVGQPYKTQQRVRMIMDAMYKPAPDGLGGNDDTGQMSAWYIFSSLGFYPVAPGSDVYALGSPKIKEATLTLENGKTFTVSAKNQSAKNVYVSKVELNGKLLNSTFIKHADITNGGNLVFYMGSKPKK
ncbi:sugar hydrolase [Flavobacterium rivuli WB 3.3-2 = DSM 21788]|uniref:Sugar hydrolase n=1 Tax=Flavobacterium rivuli WB 3.3-2 = DSM 21788 TaxID=1121895 RepID=A0A0A2MB33_9FLAO|nr:GH92 family glycosyl hydrolase [Flavobacterium rivuli]KGO85495.1 sugar hydrolase [Flavobacterium rivuli WB 3.3-2 = DSM 21788]